MKIKRQIINTVFSLRFFTLIFLTVLSSRIVAQNVGINASGSAPHSAAGLDLDFTDKGLLIPRVSLSTILDATTIASPTVSLLAYNTNAGIVGGSGTGFYYWNGTRWVTVLNGLSGWSTTGNSGTVDGTNFLGTTDNIPLNFRVNNSTGGRVEVGGSTFFGYRAGTINTSTVSVGIGAYALNAYTATAGNTAVGFSALAANMAGGANTALGEYALTSNLTGGLNTAMGQIALQSCSTCSNNTALGWHTLHFNTADENTAVGAGAMHFNSTGAYNTAVGFNALMNPLVGNYNTAIGYATYGLGPFNNSTALGANAIAINANDIVRIGDAAIVSIGGQVGWTTLSDARIKNDVQENVPGLTFIKALRPVTYYYDMDKEHELLGSEDLCKGTEHAINSMRFTGFLAQEVEAAAKKIGYNFSGVDKIGTLWGLRYAEFTVPLVKAVQEQQVQIEKLQTENQTLKAENTNVLNEVKALKADYEARLKTLETTLGRRATK